MRNLLLITAILLSVLAAAQTKTPVVVELFTSEGCSSCPPADQLVTYLDKTQPIAGADLIVLGEHVDYWDHDGWKDRFSSRLFTTRQQDYSFYFTREPYTPQIVVNGHAEFVGNDSSTAMRTLAEAAKPRKSSPQIHLTREGDHLHIQVSGAERHPVNVFCAITERDLSTKVGAGENRGRELHHTAVVRTLAKVGATHDGGFDTEFPLKLSPDWRAENLRAVVFLQNGNAGEITGAFQIPLK